MTGNGCEILTQLNTFISHSVPAEFAPSLSPEAVKAVYDQEKQTIVTRVTALIIERDELEHKVKIAESRMESLDNENHRLISILRNNSHNSGATTAVDHSSVTTYRMSRDETPGISTSGIGDAVSVENRVLQEQSCEQGSDSADLPAESKVELPVETTAEGSQEKSANQYNSRTAQSGTEDGKRCAGGQKGHQGTTLTEADARKIIEITRSQYGIEPTELHIGDPARPDKVKYRIGLIRIPVVTIVHYHADEEGKYHIPESENSKVAYDNSIRGEMAYLHLQGNMTFNKIAAYYCDSTNGLIHPTESTVFNAQKHLSFSSQPSIDWITEGLQKNDTLYTDATYTYKNGASSYIRNLSSKEAVLYVPMDKKTLEALQGIPILPDYKGILIHDHEVVMYHFGVDHGECIVHLMRYGRKDMEETGNQWAKDLIDFFVRTNQEKETLLSQGVHEFSCKRMKEITHEYGQILSRGFAQNRTVRYAYARQNEKTFLKRLVAYRDNHLLFLRDFRVDWNNNASERDLRKAKRHTVVSGGFRSDDGMDIYCRNLSVLETMKKQGINPWSGIFWLLNNGQNIFAAEELKEAS